MPSDRKSGRPRIAKGALAKVNHKKVKAIRPPKKVVVASKPPPKPRKRTKADEIAERREDEERRRFMGMPPEFL